MEFSRAAVRKTPQVIGTTDNTDDTDRGESHLLIIRAIRGQVVRDPWSDVRANAHATTDNTDNTDRGESHLLIIRAIRGQVVLQRGV